MITFTIISTKYGKKHLKNNKFDYLDNGEHLHVWYINEENTIQKDKEGYYAYSCVRCWCIRSVLWN